MLVGASHVPDAAVRQQGKGCDSAAAVICSKQRLAGVIDGKMGRGVPLRGHLVQEFEGARAWVDGITAEEALPHFGGRRTVPSFGKGIQKLVAGINRHK